MYTKDMTTTQQVDGKHIPNPTGKGGFGDNPQNRNPGGWDKTQSISYQYNLIMRLSPDALEDFKPETVAQQIALARVKAAKDPKYGLPDSKEITDRTEGKAPQSIDVTSGGEQIKTTLVEFIGLDGSDPGKDNDKNTG